MASLSTYQPARWFPDFPEVRAMLKSPAVMVAAIAAGTLLGLGLLATVGWLLYADKPVTDLLSLVSLLISGATYAKAKRIEQQTNGNTSRLMDHALGPVPATKE